MFLKLSNISLKKNFQKKIKKVYTTLHHIAFDRNFLTDVYYIQCYDPKLSTYRVTLYPNANNPNVNILKPLNFKKKKLFHLTVEVISSEVPQIKLLEKIISELYLMKIISKKSQN